MVLKAKDIMTVQFDTIHEDATVQEAIRLMKFAPKSHKDRRIFGLMVTNDAKELVGMIAMHDILFHARPPYMKLWEHKTGLTWAGQFDAACNKLKTMHVKEIMTTTMVTVTEDAALPAIMDIFTKKHLRRIPVLRGKTIMGIIYVSDLFYEISKLFPMEEKEITE